MPKPRIDLLPAVADILKKHLPQGKAYSAHGIEDCAKRIILTHWYAGVSAGYRRPEVQKAKARKQLKPIKHPLTEIVAYFTATPTSRAVDQLLGELGLIDPEHERGRELADRFRKLADELKGKAGPPSEDHFRLVARAVGRAYYILARVKPTRDISRSILTDIFKVLEVPFAANKGKVKKPKLDPYTAAAATQAVYLDRDWQAILQAIDRY